MILLLDNYDSFTWNLFHYVEQLTSLPVDVIRNDAITAEEAGKYKGIILSPGPGLPGEAGNLVPIIMQISRSIPMLGICLGHQALGEAYGAQLTNLESVQHGVQRAVHLVDKSDLLFKEMEGTFQTGHYHSWNISRNNFPGEINITAVDDNDEIMAITHRRYPFSGVQFHPESILTEHGLKIIHNWLTFHHLL